MAAKKKKLTHNQKILTPGKSGNVEIQHFNVSEVQSALHYANDPLRGVRDTYVPPGDYVRLLVDGKMMMSDTPWEIKTTDVFVAKAHGHVLITGLGLGLVVMDLLKKPEVNSVTVVENNVHVIRLTHARLRDLHAGDGQFIVSQGDAFTWKPTDLISSARNRWNCILHDIWPDVSDLHLPNMAKLTRRYAHWLDKSDPDRFQFVWEQHGARWMRTVIRKAEKRSIEVGRW